MDIAKVKPALYRRTNVQILLCCRICPIYSVQLVEALKLLNKHLGGLRVITNPNGVVNDEASRQALAILELIGGTLTWDVTNMRG
jgi:hypothetical protein